jgi:Leucine-rich repeat (LRR) protein
MKTRGKQKSGIFIANKESINMKKVVLLLLSSILIVSCSKEDIKSIPMDSIEESFRNYLLENFDRDMDGVISEEEAELVTEIDVSSRHNISINGFTSINGIEYFTNLSILKCSFNHIASIDVSKNLKLKTLECGYNFIQELDVSNNHELEVLSCRNHFTSILKSIKINPELKMLDIEGHGMVEIDFSGNQNLKELTCGGLNITLMDVSRSVIETLHCMGQNYILSYINAEGCKKLKNITCSGGNSNGAGCSLNLANCQILEEIDVYNINELNVNNCSKLEKLFFYSAKLNKLDLKTNPALKEFKANSTSFENIDFGNKS